MNSTQALMAFHNLCLYFRTHWSQHIYTRLVAFDRFLYDLHIFCAYLLCQYVPTAGEILTEFGRKLFYATIDAFMFGVDNLELKFPFDENSDFAHFDYNFIGFQWIFKLLLNQDVVDAMLLLTVIDETKHRKEKVCEFIGQRMYGPEAELRYTPLFPQALFIDELN